MIDPKLGQRNKSVLVSLSCPSRRTGIDPKSPSDMWIYQRPGIGILQLVSAIHLTPVLKGDESSCCHLLFCPISS